MNCPYCGAELDWEYDWYNYKNEEIDIFVCLNFEDSMENVPDEVIDKNIKRELSDTYCNNSYHIVKNVYYTIDEEYKLNEGYCLS
jgi:hypothetical protein